MLIQLTVHQELVGKFCLFNIFVNRRVDQRGKAEAYTKLLYYGTESL